MNPISLLNLSRVFKIDYAIHWKRRSFLIHWTKHKFSMTWIKSSFGRWLFLFCATFNHLEISSCGSKWRLLIFMNTCLLDCVLSDEEKVTWISNSEPGIGLLASKVGRTNSVTSLANSLYSSVDWSVSSGLNDLATGIARLFWVKYYGARDFLAMALCIWAEFFWWLCPNFNLNGFNDLFLNIIGCIRDWTQVWSAWKSSSEHSYKNTNDL